MIEKIALGAAQLGGQYGITNTEPKLNEEKIEEIIFYAKNNGIKTIDTAINYDSESYFSDIDLSDLKINSKLPKVPARVKKINEWIRQKIYESLENLDISDINCLFLHNPNQLFEKKGEEIWRSLENLKQEKLVKKIGVSIYDPYQLDDIDFLYDFDVIQSPFNLLDRRLQHSGWFKKKEKKGIEVQVRSVFLQGLLLLKKEKLPEEFFKWAELWEELDLFLNNNNLSILDLLLSFIKSFEEIDTIVLGIDNLMQLKEIINAMNIEINHFPKIYSQDENLINPLNWNLYKNNKKEF
jgi:aryl-alcohol dehydrogenase-like predicted oxidoreductase